VAGVVAIEAARRSFVASGHCLPEESGVRAQVRASWPPARGSSSLPLPLRLGSAKGKDTANSLGPMLVTPDELEPFRSGRAFDLEMTGYVDGDLVSQGRWNTSIPATFEAG
jgi:hypothetical protein